MMKDIIEIAIQAGMRILEVYNDTYNIYQKADLSPLTLADQLSHEYIKSELCKLSAVIPVLSEEGDTIPFEERKNWSTFWMIDPLDGTKEFIKKNDEFTVNIALIKESRPVMGVIYAPALDILYFAEKNKGAFKIMCGGTSGDRKSTLINSSSSFGKKVLISKSHLSKATLDYVDLLQGKEGEIEFASIGSSLKFCMIAEGSAQYYPRLAPTMEWDTAAGQIIVEEANGQVLEYETGKPLVYNKEILINPSFICSIS